MAWETIQQAYTDGRPFTVLTCYDYPSACLQQAAGIEVIFVGDSVGTNVLGYESEREVTLADMQHHVRAVSRGVSTSELMADLPYATYADPAMAVANARLIADAGATIIKMEDPSAEVVAAVSGAGHRVCAHLGYTPQTIDRARVQAKDLSSAEHLFEQAFALQKAGASLILIELVPIEVATLLTEQLSIPTIGIGAGPGTSSQVQVWPDVIGFSERVFRHAKVYADARTPLWMPSPAYVAKWLSDNFQLPIMQGRPKTVWWMN